MPNRDDSKEGDVEAQSKPKRKSKKSAQERVASGLSPNQIAQARILSQKLRPGQAESVRNFCDFADSIRGHGEG